MISSKPLLLKFSIGLIALLQPLTREPLLDLQETTRLALSGNKELSISRLEVIQAKLSSQRIGREFGPRLDLKYENLREDSPSLFLARRIEERNLNLGSQDLNHPGPHSHSSLGLHFQLPLSTGGLKNLSRQISKIRERITDSVHSLTKNEIIAGAVSLLLHHRVALEELKTQSSALERIQSHLREMEIKARGGSILKTDLLSMQVRKEEVRMKVVQAHAQVETSRATLSTFLGMDLDHPVKIKTPIGEFPPLPLQLKDALESGDEHRMELKKSEWEILVSENLVKQAQTDRKWKVSLFGNYQSSGSSLGIPDDGNSYIAGIAFSKNLFDHSLTRRKEQEVAKLVEKNELERERIRSQVRLEIKSAFERLKSARESVKVSKVNTQLAQENLELMKRYYGGGSVTATSLLEADQAYTNALLRGVLNRSEEDLARMELLRSMGLSKSLLQSPLDFGKERKIK